ncbi:MAG: cytochrome C [Rhodomicrobium sp.]
MLALRSGALNASKNGTASRSQRQLLAFLSTMGVAAVFAGAFVQPQPASAVPAYARQTGQPCATCHTAFPELTPYGRQFKLMGYTAGGTRCGDGSALTNEQQVPLSVMAWPATFTSYKDKAANPTSPPGSFNDNDWIPGQFSLFVAGQYYCNVGGFAQMTYDRPGFGFGWDNTDIRYANTGRIEGTNIVYGVTANNNPTVQDVWNSTPAWAFPYIASEVAPTPAAATMLGGSTWAQRVGGAGAYVWIDNMFYAELSAYGALDPRTLTTLGQDPTDGTPRFSGGAPYWRFAVEKTWDKNSLMFGTFGMYANVAPTNAGVGGGLGGPPQALALPGITDPFLDIGVDAQYQYIGDCNIFTVRASWIWEHQKLNVENNPLIATAANPTDELNDLNISASYIYDRTYSCTAGYFATWGTSDAGLYANFLNNSPNSNGWNVDVAYLPFSNGGPDLWPWFNARIGVLYTHYDEFNGTSGPSFAANGSLVKASGNDTVFLYTWLMF